MRAMLQVGVKLRIEVAQKDVKHSEARGHFLTDCQGPARRPARRETTPISNIKAADFTPSLDHLRAFTSTISRTPHTMARRLILSMVLLLGFLTLARAASESH